MLLRNGSSVKICEPLRQNVTVHRNGSHYRNGSSKNAPVNHYGKVLRLTHKTAVKLS